MRLEYQIATVGEAQLKRVLRSIETEALASARRGASRDQRFAQQRVTTATTAARRVTRTEASIEREKQRATARARAHEHRTRMMDLAARERAIKRETAEIRKQNQEIEKQIRASRRRAAELERGARRAQVIRERTAGRIMSGAARITSGGLGVLGAGLRTVGGIAAIGGTIAAGNAVRTQMDEGAMASQLANQAGRPEIKGELLKEAQTIKGFTGSEALGALVQFTDLTGDLDTARNLMQELGQFALATGTRFEDAAAAAGNFSNNLDGIEDPAKRAAAVMEAMRALGGQGMAGAVEIKDLAGGGATLGAVASQMAGDPLENIKKAGVLAQAARSRGGADSPAEALTAVARFSDMVAANAEKLEAIGVNVGKRDSKGNLTEIGDVRALVADILEKTGGDLGTLNELLGVRGQKVARGFSQAFKERGRKGVFDQFDELMRTELAVGDIGVRAASRLEDPDLQFKEAIKEFNAAIGGELIQHLPRFSNALREAIPALTDLTIKVINLAEWFAENPFIGIGAIFTGFLVKELAVAGIGAAVRAAITAAIGGSALLDVVDGAPGGGNKGGKSPRAPKVKGGRGFFGALRGAANWTGLASLGGAAAGFIGATVAGGVLNQHQVQNELEANPGIVPPSMFNYSPYAAAGLPGAVPFQQSADSGEERPRFRKIREDDSGEDLKDAAEAQKQAAASMEKAAEQMRLAAANTTAERSSPMSKR